MFNLNTGFSVKREASIDLHGGIKCKVARELVITKLKYLAERKVGEVTIITGIGNDINANGTSGVLYKAFPTWLKSPELRPLIKSCVKNPGHYTVCLNVDVHEDPQSKLAKDFLESPIGRLISGSVKEKLEAEVQNGGSAKSQGLLGIFYIETNLGSRNIKEGIRLIKVAAERGDQFSQLIIAQAHCSGEYSDHGIRKDHRKSVDFFLKVIAGEDKNHTRESHFHLGSAYFLGVGADQDDVKGIQHLTIAANERHRWAQFFLADIYEYGIGIGKDNNLANNFYLKAADQDVIDAQIKLADKYANGDGIELDLEKSLQWRLKAALLDHAESQFLVGEHYSVVKKNHEMAYKWYLKAALQNHSKSRLEVARSALFGLPYAAAEMVLAWQWLQEAVAKKDADALYLLFTMYQTDNQFVKKDVPKAVELLRESAELGCVAARKILIKSRPTDIEIDLKTCGGVWILEMANDGDAESQFLLGEILEGKNSVEEAIFFYLQAAEQDYIPAQLKLYSFYTERKYANQNDAEASKWIKRAADFGDSFAEYVVGYCYSNGLYGFEEDASKAYDWLLKSAEKGETKAQIELADIIIKGRGTREEKRKDAAKWLQMALDGGDEDARILLLGIDKLVAAFHNKRNIYSRKQHVVKPVPANINVVPISTEQKKPIITPQLELFLVRGNNKKANQVKFLPLWEAWQETYEKYEKYYAKVSGVKPIGCDEKLEEIYPGIVDFTHSMK